MTYKKVVPTLLIFFSVSAALYAQAQPANNEELSTMYKEDQSDRKQRKIDWSEVNLRDSIREARVYEMLDSNLLLTGKDYYHAAMIFQHGSDTVASTMAIKMMRTAIEKNSTISKWLLAAAIDRDLMRRDLPQIYGTQYHRLGADAPWQIYQIDSSRVTDEERKAYGVKTLAEQRVYVRHMNKKKLSTLIGEKTIEQIMLICQQDGGNSEYDVTQSGINRFGYQLMAEENYEDALKIFRMNVELYPKGYNTYDSYGECLLKLGKEEEAITAYKKSLELNPKNKNATEVLEKLGAE